MSVSASVEAVVNVPIEKVWLYWNAPEHVTQWYFAADTWHAPRAENDLKDGGKYLIRMEAKDGSAGFDLVGTYDSVKENELLDSHFPDGRRVTVTFASEGDSATKVVETFDTEQVHPVDFQIAGWQAILNNFKAYAESK